MIDVWGYSLISVAIVSAISFLGALTLVFKKGALEHLLFFMVSFSAGALLGDVFLHLLPEVVREYGKIETISVLILAGIMLFFIFEKFITWWHHHLPSEEAHIHPVAYTILFGDGLHNFIDGMIIAGSFFVSIPVGIATTLAVIFHEIPQEIGNFGVLIRAGLGTARALFLNFLSALTAFLGAILVLVLGANLESFTLIITSFTIGGFIYIAGSDLIPELHKERHSFLEALAQLAVFALGIGIMALLLLLG